MTVNKALVLIEIAVAIVVIVFAVLWVVNPDRNYEPIIVLLSTIGVVVVEFIRRSLPKQRAPNPEIAALTERVEALLSQMNKSDQAPTQAERSHEKEDVLLARIKTLLSHRKALIQALEQIAAQQNVGLDLTNWEKTKKELVLSAPFDKAIKTVLDFTHDLRKVDQIEMSVSKWVDGMAEGALGYLNARLESSDRPQANK
ncbi:MAG: hypothetical protein AAF429_04955 [Pseudomonadota bacterium]